MESYKRENYEEADHTRVVPPSKSIPSTLSFSHFEMWKNFGS